MAGTNIKSAVTSTLTFREVDESGLALSATCTGAPPTTADIFSHGCLIVRTDSGTGNKAVYENVGSSAVPSWNLIGDVTAGEITLAENNLLQGNSSGVGAAVTDITLTKETNHTTKVADSTTANTAGGNLVEAAGKGTGTAAGGNLTLNSGASSNGTAVNPGASGNVVVASGAAGTATTGTAGAAGSVTIGGTAGGASTGASSTAGAGSDVNITAGAGGASSGGGDTGGRGGNVVQTAGAAGAGATPGIAGMIFRRSPQSQKYTATAMTDSATISAAAILGGMIKGTPTAAANYTTPTGAVLAAALPAAFTTGDSVDVSITNVATNDTFDITVVAGASGITLVGNAVVEANSADAKRSSGIFRFLCTGASTFDVYRIA